MTTFDGAAFGAEIIAAVKGYVDPIKTALDEAKAENIALRARIEALEARAPEPGPAGPPGSAGADGAPGLDGRDGAPGAQGPQGERGPKGDVGPAGPVGMVGDTGERGEKGLDGKDGRDGQPGAPGAPGRDGKDGRDGLGFDDLTVTHDGERGFAFELQRGERTKTFAFTVPAMIYRTVWTPGTYAKGDAVTWRGSLWVALRDTSTKPDDAASDWQLAAKKGRDGKDAARGAQ